MRLALALFLAGAVMAPTRCLEARPTIGRAAIPQFLLQDQLGKAQTRESILGPKGAMLVFVRSLEAVYNAGKANARAGRSK